MLGDKIVVKKHHSEAAEGVYEILKDKIAGARGRLAITVAGESGSGKSEIATEIGRIIEEKAGLKYVVFHQDDYFIRPPKTNTEYRKKGLKHVGMHEVRLNLLDEHLKLAKNPQLLKGEKLKKPLIDYDKDAEVGEEIDLSDIKIAIAEGTYTTSLENADFKVFIDRTYIETKGHRLERGRDKLDSYVEEILKKEHEIISGHKKMADIIIDENYKASEARA